MNGQNPRVDPRVRLAIVQWPDDAPRGAVSAFCAEQGIWRKTFYERRARARSEGPAAALEPHSTRPASSPTRIGQEMVLRALAVRSALESSGLDHGPISVHDKMRSMGLEAPSPASLARIFRRKGVARSEPRKRPRSAWRRFVYPAPNACWQLDATEYVLAGGRKAVIFQLQDDHSRLAVASLVAPGETSDAAIAVFDKGVAAHGVPQRLLTDNGAAHGPQPTGTRRTPGGARAGPRGRAPRRQALQTHHPRATTSASTRPCSATSTSSPRPSPSPTSRPGSTPSTTSTTPSAPTRACPGASPHSRRGTPPPSPSRPDPTECTTSPPSRPASRRPAPGPRSAVNDEAGSGPTAPSV